jgi:hypothetical protein
MHSNVSESERLGDVISWVVAFKEIDTDTPINTTEDR